MVKRDQKGRFVAGVTVGEFSPRWEGGKNKYRKNFEEYLGRKLNPEEVVHHIDGNRKNNDIRNLTLFKNNAEHLKHHLQKYKEVEKLLEPVNLGEVVSKRDGGGQSRKWQVRKCCICNKLFWAHFYGKAKQCNFQHNKKIKTKGSRIVSVAFVLKICRFCCKEYATIKSSKSKFCNQKCYFEYIRQFGNPNRFKIGHKSFSYWLGKKRTQETKDKISQTKKERYKNGYYQQGAR